MKTKKKVQTRNKMIQDLTEFANPSKNCEFIEDFETESRKHYYKLKR